MRDPAGDIQEGKVADHAAGFAQARGKLRRQLQQDVRIFLGQCAKAGITDLGDFGVTARAYPGAAIGCSPNSPISPKKPPERYRPERFQTFLVLDQDGDRALDDVIQHIRLVPRVDNDAFWRVFAPVAMFEEPLDAGIDARRDTCLFHVACLWDSVHMSLSVNMPTS
jgi:hypothetical protein